MYGKLIHSLINVMKETFNTLMYLYIMKRVIAL